MFNNDTLLRYNDADYLSFMNNPVALYFFYISLSSVICVDLCPTSHHWASANRLESFFSFFSTFYLDWQNLGTMIHRFSLDYQDKGSSRVTGMFLVTEL